jgi:hypothetical protein
MNVRDGVLTIFYSHRIEAPGGRPFSMIARSVNNWDSLDTKGSLDWFWLNQLWMVGWTLI